MVVRHAKAEQFASSDHARELTDSGRRAAEEAGEWLATEEIEADYALVSSATRALQTWHALADGAGWDVEADVDDSLYAADPDTVLDVIRTVPEDSRCVVVLGHNPTMASLAQLLDDGDGDPDAEAEMTGDFPTSAVAVFGYDGGWEDLEFASATLLSYRSGRA